MKVQIPLLAGYKSSLSIEQPLPPQELYAGNAEKSTYAPVPAATMQAYAGMPSLKFGAEKKESPRLYMVTDEKKNIEVAKKLVDAATKEYENWRKKIDKYEWLGCAVGIASGLPVSALTLMGDLGLATVGGAVAGTKAGGKLGEKIHAKSLHDAENKLIKAKSAYEYHSQRLTEAETAMSRMDKILETVRQRVKKDPEDLSFVDWNELKDFRSSDCQDVRQKLEGPFNTAMIGLFPEYGQLFKQRVGKFDNLVELMDQLVVKIQNPVEEDCKEDLIKQVDAIRQLHRIESTYQVDRDTPQSRKILRALLLSGNGPALTRITILQEMCDFPQLRMPDEEMKLYLEQQIGRKSIKDDQRIAILDLVNATAFSSSTLNFHLKRIQQTHRNEPLGQKAADVLEARKAVGLYQDVDSEHVVKELTSVLVGNPALEDSLYNVLARYKDAVFNPHKKQPALTLWMDGEPGIGKTLLVNRLHQTMHGTDHGLVNIVLSPDKTPADIINQLKAARPLQGKTIFFDEFQELSVLNEKNQEDFLQFLKLLLSPVEQDSQKLLDFGLDFTGSIVAFASNEKLDDIPALNKSKTARSARDRFSFVNTIPLNDDLRDYVEDVVREFGPRKLYLKEFPELGHQLKLTPEAQKYLLKKLQQSLPKNPEIKISGRRLVATLANELKNAIYKAERQNQRQFPIDSQGHIQQPLTFRIQKGALAVDMS